MTGPSTYSSYRMADQVGKPSTGRSANIRGFLGRSPTQTCERPSRKSEEEFLYNSRVKIPSLSRRIPAKFSKTKEDERSPSPTNNRRYERAETCSQRRVTARIGTPQMTGSSAQTRAQRDRNPYLRSKSSSIPSEVDDSDVDRTSDISALQSVASSSLDSSTLAGTNALLDTFSSSAIGNARSESGAQESAAVLDLIDNLEDIDETYMLSVFWNAGDTSAVTTGDNASLARTRCSFASTCSTSTSTTNYTWKSSSRRRHAGAYKNRVRAVAEAPKGSWIDTMEESSSQFFGAFNGWTATTGFSKESKVAIWDAKPDPSTWDVLDHVFDHGHPSERIEI